MSTRRLRRGAAIAVAMGVMNIATYGYTIVVAHSIGKEQYGAFSALMGVLLVVNVLSLGLQATGARRISANPDHVGQIEQVVLGVGLRSAVALGVLCLLLAPVLNVVLHLESLATAALVAAAAAPLTYMGAQAGVLQGERRWEPLALVYLFQGLGRLICGLAMILIWESEFAAMLGVALGAWLPVLVGYIALRAPRETAHDEGHPGLDLIKEVGHSSQALLAFFALSNADILLARALLSDGDSGLYAAGLIMAKAVLFLPQFVVVIAFPSMSTQGASRRTLVLALSLVTGLGFCAVLGTLVLPDLAMVFVGGNDYTGIEGDLWKFAILGTLLAMIQLLVYSALARRQRRALLMIWTTLAVLLLCASQVESVTWMVHLVLALDGLLFLGLFATALTTRPEPLAPAGEAEDVEPRLLHHEG